MKAYVYEVVLRDQTFPPKEGRPGRTIFKQTVYFDCGGKFPLEAEVSHDSVSSAYPVGEYEVCPTSFKVNQYKRLEVDPFNVKLLPAKAAPSASSLSTPSLKAA